MPVLTQNIEGGGRHRPYFDGFIYIRYAVPPYSGSISDIYLLPFGTVWLGSGC